MNEFTSSYFSPTLLQSTDDILNITLAGGFVIIVIFLSVALFYLTIVLRDISHITQTTKKTTDELSNYILKPISIISKLALNLKPILEIIQEKLRDREKTNTKKRKKSL